MSESEEFIFYLSHSPLGPGITQICWSFWDLTELFTLLATHFAAPAAETSVNIEFTLFPCWSLPSFSTCFSWAFYIVTHYSALLSALEQFWVFTTLTEETTWKVSWKSKTEYSDWFCFIHYSICTSRLLWKITVSSLYPVLWVHARKQKYFIFNHCASPANEGWRNHEGPAGTRGSVDTWVGLSMAGRVNPTGICSAKSCKKL